MHVANAPRNATSAICHLCYGLHWATSNVIKRTQACTNICLLISYLITLPLNTKWQMKSPWSILRKSSPTSCPKFVLQDIGTEFKNELLMSVFTSLSIKHIYSNPYYPRYNSRRENMHNFLKCTIMKFTYGSQLEWDDALLLAKYCLISPYQWMTFYLVHGRDPLKGRLSNLQNYCRYWGDQPDWLVVQELRKVWKLHAKLLKGNRKTEPADKRKMTKVSNLEIGQLVFVKDHWMGTFNPSYVFDHRVVGILKDSMDVLTTPDGKQKRNIHHIKPMTALEASASVISQFQDSIQKTPGK